MVKNSNKQPDQVLNSEATRPTSYDVARLAGVSQSAVSRCFKPGASVSEKTRSKIESAAKTLGYQPNAIARGLITRRSNMVAVIISDLTNLNYPEVLSQLNKAFSELDIHVLLFTLNDDSDVDQTLDQVWQYQVDGIVAAAQLTHQQINACHIRGIPLVFYNGIYNDQHINTVCCDHIEGERLLINKLIKDGRQSFVVMSGPSNSAVSTARVQGAIGALAEHQVRTVQVAGDYSYERAQALTREIMASDTFAPDAIVCANDTMAMACMDTIRHEYQRNVPGDIAIVGFDGVATGSWDSYKLTTIVQPVERMVAATVNMLVERIEKPKLPAEKRIFAGELLVGESAILHDN